MHEQDDPIPALSELCRRLETGLARARLNKTELARKTGLGRTTVSEAFQDSEPLPSLETLAALAKALKLPVHELLELRQTAMSAAGSHAVASGEGPGRPISEWEPHALEVHPAGPSAQQAGSGSPEQRVLPGYVRREHDQVLCDVVRQAGEGLSRMKVLVGSSSTGKTRACWEAVQPLAGKGWRLWHPFDPTRAEAALEDLHRVRPRTVVWLNEAQHYFGDGPSGERIAAAIHSLLIQPERGPVLVLGTLWPEYAAEYTALPVPGRPDPHSRVRELLTDHTLTIPDAFDSSALATADVLAEAGDGLLAGALTRARADGRVTQDLAGAPELLRRYEHGTPASKAVLEAAMDARRLGVGLHIPQAFLTDAAIDYLTDNEYDQLAPDWAEQVFAQLAHLVHGKQAPLRRTTPRPRHHPAGSPPLATAIPSPGPVFRLADYLEQHGRKNRRRLCPPASFWHAAHTHLTDPHALNNLAQEAEDRHRLQWAHYLRHRAADHGHPGAWVRLTEIQERSGDRKGAETLAQQAAVHGYPGALYRLAQIREKAGDGQSAESFFQQAADRGDPHALYRLADMRGRSGARQGVEALYQQAADRGHPGALYRLTEIREKAGDRQGAETLAQQAADDGDPRALARLADMRVRSGNREGAETLYQQAADRGNPGALYHLAQIREKAGDREGVETLYQQAAERGHPGALSHLAEIREKAGDRQGAETLAQQAADRGDLRALARLADMRVRSGNREGAETLYQQAAEKGDYDGALIQLIWWQEEAGDRKGAETLAWQAANKYPSALYRLAEIRAKAGGLESAETLYRHAADLGDRGALARLTEIRERAGDREGAESLYRQAADQGDRGALYLLASEEALDWGGVENLLQLAKNHGDLGTHSLLIRMRERLEKLWPYGLDPDGTPTPPWQ
ncbi:helix-turn-helix domain-containing protein [Streptomyces sp. NBC_00631]|uniref:tetratricopeptide repeat protein n=1 Tax=Streptomyces sp. NBC_00631 TaxID=2975793 RepID=UPI0030E39C06